MSIPASELATIIPGVLSAGGGGVTLNGVVNTQDPSIPIGTAQSFPTAAAVLEWFGANSPQANMANAYFGGFENSDQLPGQLFFYQTNTDGPVAGYMRGGNTSGMSLSDFQALSGTITVMVDGASVTSAAINLASAVSPANIAVGITAGFTGGQVVCAYDPLRVAFVLRSATTGANSSVGFPTENSLTTGLLFTQETGAVVSPGAAQAVPAAAMNALVGITQNWATFALDYAAAQAENLEFAAWVQTVTPAGQERFAFFPWENALPPTEGTAPTSLGGVVQAGNMVGVAPVWDNSAGVKAAFAMGIAASLNTSATNGRATWAFKSQPGLTADVTDATVAANLVANGYNFYAAYATASAEFTFFTPGQMPGPWKWIDSYINQIALNSDLQADIMTVLTTFKSVPYTSVGTAIWQAGFADTIQQYKNFGAIVPGVTLSSTQIAAVNSAAGNPNAAATLANLGWYLLIGQATPEVRVARGSPPMKLWYCDGQSVQSVTLNSINVQ